MVKKTTVSMSNYEFEAITSGWNGSFSERITTLAMLGLDVELDKTGLIKSKLIESQGIIKDKERIIIEKDKLIKSLKQHNEKLKDTLKDKGDEETVSYTF